MSSSNHSKHHPDRPCSSCTLCGKKDGKYYSHYATWGQKEREFLMRYCENEPTPSSCICLAHYREAQRKHPASFVPKWKRTAMCISEYYKCIYPNCSTLPSNRLISPSFATVSELEMFLNVKSSEQRPLLLCNDHYQHVYRAFNSPTTCACCGIQPKSGKSFHRHCPDVDYVNSVLCGEERISESDVICLSCYKCHLEICKASSDPENGSKDQLQNFIAIWEYKYSDPSTDKLTKCILHVVLYLAKELLENRAALLPTLSRMFLSMYVDNSVYTDNSHAECTIDTEEGSVNFTSKWLLKSIKVHLHHHLKSKCVHRRYGTIVYPKNGDLLMCLSWALGRSQTGTDTEVTYENLSSIDSDDAVLTKAGNIVNDLVHKEIKRYSQLDADSLDSTIKHLDINKQIQNTDHRLWNFIKAITRTQRERGTGTESLSNTKELRRFNILCGILFCTNTWKFWEQFVFHDCLAYIMLHLGVRCSNWTLRVAALKLMAPLFVAYDRKTYQKLVPHHLADIQKYPQSVLKCLKEGFTVSISGSKGHSVAIDEAHEMCINRDMKMAIVRPTKSYLQKTSLFMRYRITAHRNLLKQLFPPTDRREDKISLFDPSPDTKKKEDNITTMIEVIQKYHMLSGSVTTDRGLVNVFNNLEATPEVQKDMLTFREVGKEHLKLYVEFHILKTASTNAPIRQHKLLTMAPKKQGKRVVNQKLTEMKQVTKCLRQRLSWCNRTGQTYDTTQEQYSTFPRAIADEKGCLRKGVKAIWKEKIGKRYQQFDVVTNNLPSNWLPEIIVFDGMFLINCKPLRTTKTITEYAMFLHNRFFVPHYRNNAKEIHLIFDAPKEQSFNPKMFEQERRDKGHASNCTHEHITFTPTTQPPTKWREFLECRQCKRSIIEAITLAYMQSIRFKLRPHQKMIVAGSYSVRQHPSCISGDGSLPTTATQYLSTAEEADLRVWRHVKQATATRILVYSPDTDVYNIGLTTIKENKEVIVQINVPQSTTQLYVHLNKLISALQGDLDLATILKDNLPRVFQMLYICSGCDYISYFAGMGKAMFCNVFFQHASFITGRNMPGELSFTTVGTIKENFLSFLRLIGTLYFKKHYSAMVSLRGAETPRQLLNSKGSFTDNTEQHESWYDDIRSIVSDRITSEEDRMPSRTSMWRHWLRSCWVAQLYQSAHEQDPFALLPPPQQSGWKIQNSEYSVDWECPELQQQIQETIDFLTKGCSCKKGCTSMRCSCVKKGSSCGPGCNCRDCKNTTVPDNPEVSTDHSDSESGDSDSDDNIETEVITGLEYEYEDMIDMQT